MTILVLDVGSSSVRALLFDADARPLAQVTRRHSFTTEPPGAATLDAAALLERVDACIDDILSDPNAADLRAVALDTFVGNMLGVDAGNRAVTPIYAYADTRSADDVLALGGQIDQEAAHQRTGTIHHTAYQPGRLAWLRRTSPAAFHAVDQWVDAGTYLYRQWFGSGESAAPCSYSAASWSGMLNRAALDWDDGWLRVLDMPKAQFPALADYTAACCGLNPTYAARWPRLRSLPFFLAVGDGAAANVGSACVSPGRIALSLGTTAALRTVSTVPLPPVPRGLWSYRVTAGMHLIGGATSEGGSIFKWAKDTLALPADAEAILSTRAPDSHGLTFLPLLAGERSPGWAANATGTIHGLRLSTAPVDILQAALEGVALRLAAIANQLGGDGAVVASGGALEASPAWTQIIANALNRPLEFAAEGEITARGTAILTLSALDGRPLTDFALPISRTVQPQPDAVEIFHAARERQAALYAKFYA